MGLTLFYITNARIPTEKAHGLQIIKMCEAFQHLGMEVQLIVPSRIQSPAMKKVRNLWAYYQVDTVFRLRYLWVPDFVRLTQVLPEKIMMTLYYLQCFIFAFCALIFSLFQGKGIYYTRDLQTLFLLCLTKLFHRRKIFFEAHEFHGSERYGWRSRVMRWIMRRIDGLIVITQRLKTLYAGIGGEDSKIFVAPDGIDVKRLQFSLDRIEARKKRQIPLDRKIICYTGHLFTWKGVYTLAESSRHLSGNYMLYIVGGMESDILALQQFITEKNLKNIVLAGYVPYHDVPVYLSAADVLVLPNSANTAIAREYTSPLKLFEYMGARRPIVASDLPALREVLRHKENAYLVQADDPKALAEGIRMVFDDPQMAHDLAATAYKEVQEYTWDQRAENILVFLNQGNVCPIAT